MLTHGWTMKVEAGELTRAWTKKDAAGDLTCSG